MQTLLTSKNDKRNYKATTLPSGLPCLFVSDPNCKSCAVSMAVAHGHFQDPDSIPGLAHLLEHCLFLGSKHYPQANAMQQFLSAHGGNLNAWTGTEFSNFHFDVHPTGLEVALQMFADMLTYPLFTPESVQREIQAIDSEFQLKRKDDLRRLYQVHKETCNPEHPFSKFSVGNAETFSSVERSKLISCLRTAHQKFFVSKNMRLCIISDRPLEDITSLAETTFDIIPSAVPPKPPALPPLYLSKHLGVQINIQPIKIARRLIVSFALPDVHPFYQSKPSEFVSHLLGDEGQGSLLYYFKANNWATNLSAGGGIDGSNFKDFNINLQLTTEGIDNIEAILNGIFYYLELIKGCIKDEWRFKEQASLAELAFQYSEQSKPSDDCNHLANQMFHYPVEHLLSGDYLVTNTDRDALLTCLACMNTQNMRIKFICPGIAVDSTAKWYDTPYQIRPIAASLLTQLQQPTPVPELHLSPKNPYVVESVKRHPVEPQYLQPSVIHSSHNTEIWFGQDDHFQLPKGDIYLSFDCAAVEQGIHISAYKRLWVALMMEHINHHYYRAGVAGLHHHLYPHQAGFSLHTSGFSQKQMTLGLELVDHIHRKHDFSGIFEQVQNKHFNALQNTLLNKPINRLFTRLSSIVQRYNHAPAELLPYVKNAKLSDIEAVSDALLSDYFLEGFIFGDWPAKQANEFAQQLQSNPLKAEHGSKIKRDVVDLTNTPTFYHQVDAQHDDAAVVLYFQSPSIEPKDVALTILVEQLLAVPFFNTMRTERQLGYLVGSGYLPINQHPGMAFYIQSPTNSAEQLVIQMQNYIDELLDSVDDYQEIWPYVRDSVIKQLNNNDTSLTMKSQRLWMAIGNNDHDFNQQSSLGATLATLTYQDIAKFCQRLRQRQNVGSLILFCAGKSLKDIPKSENFIYDIQRFKAQSTFMI